MQAKRPICLTPFRINKALKHSSYIHRGCSGLTPFRINKALKPTHLNTLSGAGLTPFRINKALKRKNRQL